jgi:NAD(P)-dependent dehydrogenase (short-subunit alcohol dehydrogenase family)
MQLLEHRNAVVYGAAGTIGRAVSKGFAAQGARVWLAGRTRATLEEVAADMRAAGGAAETAVVDALDGRAVDAHADAVVAQGGSLDVSFNLIDVRDVQGTPMAEMDVDDFMSPIVTAVRSQFLTIRAAARHMVRQGGGVILAFGGAGDPLRGYSIGGLQVAFEAVESMRRQVSSELGPQGVRFVTLRTGGIPEAIPADFAGREELTRSLEDMTMLGRCATLEDVANAAVVAASDLGRTMTAATLNISCGALIDRA